jgi:lantibiotic modifying enzyme
MLFDKSRHEPLSKSLWNQDIVQTEILSIIDDIERSQLTDACWPTHPLDAESYPRAGPKWSAYAGAAGTIHAIQILSRYAYTVSDLSASLETVYQSFLKNPDVSVEPGLQIGELGILMPAILAQPEDEELSKRVMGCMEATIELPLYEITSGQSGMMHAALALYRKTGENHWKDLYIKGAKSLMDNWTQDTDTGQWLWQSQVFGPKRHYYGACHGLAGNANILLKGADLLPTGYTEIIMKRTISTLNISVKKQANMANWPLCTKPNIDKLLVQWCHGAAGIVTGMARTPTIDSNDSKQLDQLLQETAELVWQAGPLVKGSNICHGTSGNGYAFLYLYRRTGNAVWLNRARQFAMHAIEQCQKARLRYGQGRFTLWTGDAGLAIYLYHCVYPKKAAIPGLDLF